MASSEPFVHVEPVMGTVVGFKSPSPIPEEAIEAATAVLHDADRVFSLWAPQSPMSRLRCGTGHLDLADLAPADAGAIAHVLDRCSLARDLSHGGFDPWALPGGVDPTGLVKGWAVERARDVLVGLGHTTVMVNGGGDIAVAGRPRGRPWRVGIRHPLQPTQLAAVVTVTAAVATSGNYERPGQLIEPSTGRAARGVASATVCGPHLDLADALATALAVRGLPLLEVIGSMDGYGAYLVTDEGRHFAAGDMGITDPHAA